MDKKSRQNRIAAVIRAKRIVNQTELVTELKKKGVASTQASVSRDLNELGVVKVEGAYRLPQVEPGQSNLVDRLTVDRAGDNLIIVRTGPGHAQMAAHHIDKAKTGGIIGTVAGDDTIFIAVRGGDEQQRVVRKVFTLFHPANTSG